MASALFQFRTKWYFNTPQMLARLGKWRNDVLANAGAYGKGVFRNKLGRPQRKQTKERTVQVDVPVISQKTGRTYNYSAVLFVPRMGKVIEKATGKPAPREAAAAALKIVSARVRGQGAGRPPRMGPSKQMRTLNEFALDARTESVVIGTVPIPTSAPISAASVPNLLDEGLRGFIFNTLLPNGGVQAQYAEHPYVESVLPPVQKRINQRIRSRPAGS